MQDVALPVYWIDNGCNCTLWVKQFKFSITPFLCRHYEFKYAATINLTAYQLTPAEIFNDTQNNSQH